MQQGTLNKALRQASLKTIAAFLNSDGGTLLIGVDDDGSVCGLEDDLRTVERCRDRLQQTLSHVISDAIGVAFARFYDLRFESVGDRAVCRIDVRPALEPVFLKGAKGKDFYVRNGNVTRALDAEEMHRYIRLRWPG